MKILITGSTGLLGSKLVQTLNYNHVLYPTYNNTPSTHPNSIRLDLLQTEKIRQIIEKIKPDTIIHAAAMTHVDKCEQNPELAQKINHQATKTITDAAQKTRSHLIFVSTDYVFDGEKGNYNETNFPNPINTYGKTKYAAEKAINESEIESTIIRPSVIYGDKPASGKSNFVLWVINQLSENKKISIINDQIISPTYNHNLAEMIKEVTERKLSGIYHLSGATQINRIDFVHEIAEIFNLDQPLIHSVTSEAMNWTAKRPKNSSLNINKARNTLKIKPETATESLRKLKTELNTL